MEHLIALTAALLLDLWLGDPRWLPHPVRMMGSLIHFLESRGNKGSLRRFKGVAMVLIVCSVVFVITWSITALGYHVHVGLGVVLESFFIWTTISLKGLKEASMNVYTPLTESDYTRARQHLSMIVGRDTEHLDESELARGAIETVAENTSDGITAPLFFALLGGAPLAMLYRAVNTCDSMVGYRHDRFYHFGWASARLDDVLNWVPARLTSMLLLLLEKSTFQTKREAITLLVHHSKRHPSPNSGWGEAAFAILMGIQLGGENRYFGEVSMRPTIGIPFEKMDAEHIKTAHHFMVRATLYMTLLLWIGGAGIEVAVTWS
ncbi:adenosylcobinamide-phosphate synthase CbiB [Halobacillus shinanisalinarum]|uniref:Cobalamin biosynthesis protein CobD n=1 Tax=Halobacillus shinanisalinarum TaxID=2932258 RepID=A0ABY4H5D4_9BACI|nr:adenosylcobinamide-phosphate synthase CbiB [Halobacillus shinanisalinarum]UOQ95665.1 adenosylcobinamide-phosphate synthase CbiB [Halobacillus shinanisalinarum]